MIGEHTNFYELLPPVPEKVFELPHFYVISGTKIKGPFTTFQLQKAVESKNLKPFHRVISTKTERWLLAKDISSLEFPPAPQVPPKLSDDLKKHYQIEQNEDDTQGELTVVSTDALKKLQEEKPKKKKVDKEQYFTISNDPIWFVKKYDEEEVNGPFRYLEVIRMLQNQQIDEQDQVKKTGWVWKTVNEVQEFRPSFIRHIMEKDVNAQEVLVKRQHPRSSYMSPAIIRYNGIELKGTCTTISIGGCFVEVRNLSHLKIGETVDLEILPGEVPLPIHAQARVASIIERQPKGVGLEFTQINSSLQEKIEEFVTKFLEVSSI